MPYSETKNTAVGIPKPDSGIQMVEKLFDCQMVWISNAIWTQGQPNHLKTVQVVDILNGRFSNGWD